MDCRPRPEIFLDVLFNDPDSLAFCERYLLRSGEWRPLDDDASPSLWNPQISKAPDYSIRPLASTDAIDHKTHFSDVDLRNYADTLKRAALLVEECEPDIVLVPMRGGVRPWLHLRIFCDIPIVKGKFLPFSCADKYSSETKAIMGSILEPLHGRQGINIVSIDVGGGGQGSKQMMTLLQELHQYDKDSHWCITMLLFVPMERVRDGWVNRREKKTHNFTLRSSVMGISKVVGEDLDIGMIVPSNVGKFGAFTMTSEGQDYVIESAEVPRVLDQQITHAIHFSLLQEQFSTVVDVKAKPRLLVR